MKLSDIIYMLGHCDGVEVDRPLVTWYDEFGMEHTQYVKVSDGTKNKCVFKFFTDKSPSNNDEDAEMKIVDYSSIYKIHGKVVGNCIAKPNNVVKKPTIIEVFKEAESFIPKLIDEVGWCGKSGKSLQSGRPEWYEDVKNIIRTIYEVKNDNLKIVTLKEQCISLGWEVYRNSKGQLDAAAGAQTKVSDRRKSLLNMFLLWMNSKIVSSDLKYKISMISNEMTKRKHVVMDKSMWKNIQ